MISLLDRVYVVSIGGKPRAAYANPTAADIRALSTMTEMIRSGGLEQDAQVNDHATDPERWNAYWDSDPEMHVTVTCVPLT
jgi:hypothetical protein